MINWSVCMWNGVYDIYWLHLNIVSSNDTLYWNNCAKRYWFPLLRLSKNLMAALCLLTYEWWSQHFVKISEQVHDGELVFWTYWGSSDLFCFANLDLAGKEWYLCVEVYTHLNVKGCWQLPLGNRYLLKQLNLKKVHIWVINKLP